jgi:hypothetical protein
MIYFLIAFSCLTALAGIVIVISPAAIFGLLQKYKDTLSIYFFAIVFRVLLGAALILVAAESKFPTVLMVLGWFTVAAAVVMALMGRQRFGSLMTWAFTMADRFGRVAGLFAILFGGLIFYAVT